MLNDQQLHSLLIIAVMCGITFILRVLPFIIFSGKRETPKSIIWLGKALPPAIIGMLVIYCFKDVSFLSAPFGAPELIAGGLVVLLQATTKNPLLSVGAGTIGYMILLQFIFI